MKQNLFKKIMYIICAIIFSIYLFYRMFFTLSVNLGVICFIFSLLLLLVELWDAFDFYIYLFNILLSKNKKIDKPDMTKIKYPDVDIFIATYNESEEILSNTITKCLELNYPDKNLLHIYVCDDGNRSNIKKLAKKLNVNYFSRTNRRNFKAGNYNNALMRTNSPFIATFDADMAPCADFLLETIPYFFSKEKVGFVQLPQSFRNPDIFQYRFNLEHEIPFEQDYFYNFIQTKKNNINSSIYCGTNAVISRQALIDANYFSTNTLTEDIATGLKIESKGYTGIALNKTLAYGDSVLDFDGFMKQRTRWARGCTQIFKNVNFLSDKNLTFRQKLEYLSCISYWFFGIKRMIYLLAPLLFSLFNIIAIDCNLYLFILLWFPSYMLKRLLIDAFSNNEHSSTWSKIYETILAPTLSLEVLKELFGIKKIGFEVSPKDGPNKKLSKKNIRILITHTVLLILNIIGFVVCLFKLVSSNYMPIYILSLFFMISNIFYLLIAIIFDTNNRIYDIENFTPNKVKKYKLKSLFLIFKNINWRKKYVK